MLRARFIGVSIHAPRVGSDSRRILIPLPQGCFNPRSPRGERRELRRLWLVASGVSIHAPRVGSDPNAVEIHKALGMFQSTLPAWGATHADRINAPPSHCFNPRSPRGERRFMVTPRKGGICFNPRSPRGERRSPSKSSQPEGMFQSTLPAWGATAERDAARAKTTVSIHAPRVGSDCDQCKRFSRFALGSLICGPVGGGAVPEACLSGGKDLRPATGTR